MPSIFNLWVAVAGSALFHPMIRWAAPGFYAACVEANRKQMEEAKHKRLLMDVEGGVPGELTEVTSLEVEPNDETPLTGGGPLGTKNGVYFEVLESSHNAVVGTGV